MTIIVGLICQDCIIVASDSQTSFGDHKTLVADKIRVVNFAGEGEKILIAQAGCAETSASVIAEVERIAHDCSMGDEKNVVEVIKQSVLRVRQDLRHQHFDCSPEEFKRVIFDQGLDCSLMAGFYDKAGRAHIRIFNFDSTMVREVNGWYASIGIGEPLANYIIEETFTPEIENRLGRAVAVYVVDKVIQHVRDCFEPIRVAIISPRMEVRYGYGDPPVWGEPMVHDPVSVLAQPEIESIKRTVREIEADTKAKRIQSIRSELLAYSLTLPDMLKKKKF